MMSWFDFNSFLNGLLTEGIAMVVELLIIVNVLNWLRKRDENRRLARYRTRARKLLSRCLTQIDKQLAELRDSVRRYRNQVSFLNRAEVPLPPPAETAAIISMVQRNHERLSRDFAMSLPNLDDPTADIFEAWLNQTEWMLGVWPVWRMTDPNFADRWVSDDTNDEREAYLGHLDEVDTALCETALVGSSIAASLLYAETQKGGDERLLREAKQLKDGTHVLSRARTRKADGPNVRNKGV